MNGLSPKNEERICANWVQDGRSRSRVGIDPHLVKRETEFEDAAGGRVSRFVRSDIQCKSGHEEQTGKDRDAYETSRPGTPLRASLNTRRRGNHIIRHCWGHLLDS